MVFADTGMESSAYIMVSKVHVVFKNCNVLYFCSHKILCLKMVKGISVLDLNTVYFNVIFQQHSVMLTNQQIVPGNFLNVFVWLWKVKMIITDCFY